MLCVYSLWSYLLSCFIVVFNFLNFTLICVNADNCKAELESSLREGKEFEYSCENIQRWLWDMSDSVRRELRISADQDILKQQVTDYEVSCGVN